MNKDIKKENVKKNDDKYIQKIKDTINTTKTVEELWKIGEKIFVKNDIAVCAVTYLIERAYVLGKHEIEKRIIPVIDTTKKIND